MKLAVVATVVLMSASAWAQDESGSGAAQQTQSEYGGPAILSRGGAPSVFRGGDQAVLTPFIAVSAVDQQGQGYSGYGDGVSAMLGVTGTHTWEHSVLDLDYRGTYQYYSRNAFYRGFDNSLTLGFSHQLTSRLGITLNEDVARVRNAGSLPLGSLYSGGAVGYNPLYNALTTNSVLDTPMEASVTSARLVYQHSARLSMSVGGTFIVSRQQAQQTLGADGYNANADVAYRLSRYQTISFNYGFTHFSYVGQSARTDMHGAGLGYSVRIGRYWEFALSGGASRVDSRRESTIQLDPELAQLLGESVIFEKMHNIVYAPYGSVRLTRSFRHSSWSAGYDRTVVAGNGLYAGSKFETADSSYTYSGLRRLSLQIGAGYWGYSALTQSLGRYRSYGATGGFTCRLGKGFSTVGRIDGRRFYISDSSLDRTGYMATLGISWNPGKVPLALW